MPSSTLDILYRFTLSDGKKRDFQVRLDRASLRLLAHPRERWPDWTKLSFMQCPNCPLEEGSHPRCPVAANLTDIVEEFKDFTSTEKALIEIVSETRTTSRHSTLAEGLSSLIGIYMTTSGCPHLDKLRPNVLQHLPFATAEETLFRTFAMYLLAQFLQERRGGKPDWKLERFKEMIDAVCVVNRKFCERLYGTCIKDVHVNAVVHLNCFAEISVGALSPRSKRLDELAQAFEAYLPEDITID
ncbi:MAG: hypothetical protein WC969_01600 [Elusimicrobiota bacterium]|jgi:hypothetical protein